MYFHRYTPCRKLPLLGQFGLSLPGGVQQTPSPPHLLMNMNERVLFIFIFYFLIIIVWLCWNLFAKGKCVKKKKKKFFLRTRLTFCKLEFRWTIQEWRNGKSPVRTLLSTKFALSNSVDIYWIIYLLPQSFVLSLWKDWELWLLLALILSQCRSEVFKLGALSIAYFKDIV